MVAIVRCLAVAPLLLVLAGHAALDIEAAGDGSLVTVLSGPNFDAEVLSEKGAILVVFHAPGKQELSSTLEEAAQLVQQSTVKKQFVPRIGTLDITRAPAIASRYQVVRYPTLLLFAEEAAIDGEEYTLAQNSKAISRYLIALATRPNIIKDKKTRHQLEQAALRTTVEIESDDVDQFYEKFWSVNNLLMYFHSALCDECKDLLKEFAIASKILAADGYPHGAMTHLQGQVTQVDGQLAVEEFPQPCTDCEPCADTKAPCLWLIDVTVNGTNVSSVDSGIDVRGLRTHESMMDIVRDHHRRMERSPVRGRTVAELDRLAETWKDEL